MTTAMVKDWMKRILLLTETFRVQNGGLPLSSIYSIRDIKQVCKNVSSESDYEKLSGRYGAST